MKESARYRVVYDFWKAHNYPLQDVLDVADCSAYRFSYYNEDLRRLPKAYLFGENTQNEMKQLTNQINMILSKRQMIQQTAWLSFYKSKRGASMVSKNISCAYVINFYDIDGNPVFCKVGSTNNFTSRYEKILNGEYEKRTNGQKVHRAQVEKIYKTSDRYGAYTIENMLHTHFLKQGYERDGNDYFLDAEGNKEELNNDFPLRLMSILLSPDIDHKPLYASIKRLLTLMKYI